MFTYTNPRNSLKLHKIKPSPFSTYQKRKLFFEDNADKNISQSDVYDPEQISPEKSFNTNLTELSPTLSEKFESLISNSKHEHLCSSSITTDKPSNFQQIEHNTTTPLNSKKIKGDKNLPNKIFNLNTIKNNKAEYEVKASCSYDYKTISPKDVGSERVTRSHYNPKVKIKLFKDNKSTSKKRPRSTSPVIKTKINLFPDGISPFKKKPVDIGSCKKEEVNKSTKKNIVKKTKTPKQSSSKKNVWTEYMNQNKPKRILMEQHNNRKFFKSKVIHNDILNKKKDNDFNSKVINWNNENSISSTVEVKESNLKDPEIFNDEISENDQYINKSIEFDDSHSTTIQSLLPTPTLKRKYKSVQNHSSILRPVLSRNDVDGEKCISAYSSPAAYLKDVSSTDFDVTVMNESVNTSIDFNDTVTDEIANTSTNTTNTSVIVNESPRTNLFPIFINGTPSSSHIILSSEKTSTVKKLRRIIDNTQYQIYAGQKKFGGVLCKECGIFYSRGEPEDEAEHDKYHKAKDIFKYKTIKNEKVIFKDFDERIVVISGSDTKVLCSKALEVMSYVDKELGCSVQHSVLPTTKKVYLYIKKKQVIGCLVIDLISQAYHNVDTESEDMVVVSEDSYPVKVGVNSIWIKWDCRRTGIATKLLDYFRKNYAFGHILTLDEIAFTVPTRAGKQFIKKYTKKNDFLVYTGW
ncbi:N-acetyltransferase ESCO2-like [Aphis gossypii]|uniref:N-acetyltransferase ESCO2-like n=1 Tax=Aphis gossypii TaxID=80765 RepID=UPI002158C0D9|nr:N-acetyltransferase ESCO2-like [Aphis gossypii]XP_050057476.1 N-acetyltransferase ESCO2-like [Aphis gossypii]